MSRNFWLRFLCSGIVCGLLCHAAQGQTVINGNFEANSFATYPGYINLNAPISGWVSSNDARIGLNPAGTSPFADNGQIPGGNVAFIQSIGGTTGTLSQTINGLTVGQTYRLSYRFNDRSGTQARLLATIGGNTLYETPAATFAPVGGSNPYYYAGNEFVATATSMTLTFANIAAAGDSTVVLDNVAISTANSNGLTTFAWTNDATSRVSANWRYTAAASFGSNSVSPTINGVTFTGAGGAGNPSGTGYTTSGLTATYAGPDSNNIIGAGGGSAQLARSFNYGGANESVTFTGLTVGRQYVATFYTVGFDAIPSQRNIRVSDGNGGFVTINAMYGNDNGFGLEYTYTATSTTQTFTFDQINNTFTYHNYGVSNRQNFLAWDSGAGADQNWNTASNWDAVNNAATPTSSIAAYIDNGGTAVLNGGTASAASLQLGGAGSGTLNYISGTLDIPEINMAANGTFQASNTTAQSIASNFTGSGQFLKTGAGELTLTGSSSYTGATTISGGALIVNGALNGGGPVTVQNGATIGGTGTVLGNVTIQSGGTDAPGDGVGTGTFGSSTWQAGGNIQIEINNANGVAGGPSGWDLRQIDGTLDISDLVNGNFNVQLIGDADGFDAREDYLWQFVSYNSLATGTLDLQSLADSFNVDTSLFTGDMQGGQFTVVDTGSGLALSFAAVPEPATIGLWLVLGASLACGIARRVRRAS